MGQDLAALAAQGLPPSGRGVYVRDRPELVADVAARFGVVNSRALAASEQVRALGGAWLISGPSEWRPAVWRRGLQRLLDRRSAMLAEGLTVRGIIADPEGGWPDLSSGELLREAHALGAALASQSSKMRVGLTTYPHWPGRRALAAEAGAALWYSPQIYGRTAQGAEVFSRWYGLWADLVGPQHCIPSVALWGASEMHRTAAGYRDYLAMVPHAAGCIAWPSVGEPAAHMVASYREHQPGGSAVETSLYVARDLLLRPAALAIGIALVAAVVLLVGGSVALRGARA